MLKKAHDVRRSTIFSIYDFVKSLNDEHSCKKYMPISTLRLTCWGNTHNDKVLYFLLACNIYFSLFRLNLKNLILVEHYEQN